MLHYAAEQVSARLGRLVFQIHNGARPLDADAVHDLRVAIRRFSQAVRVFAALFPKQETKQIRKQLRRLRDVAGQVRDRDIALEFLAGAGVGPDGPLRARIAEERELAETSLAEELKRWSNSKFSSRWRSALRLDLQ